MAFYLTKAIFINRAPFDHLELDFKEKGINVLSAIKVKEKRQSYLILWTPFMSSQSDIIKMSLKEKRISIIVYQLLCLILK